MGNIGHFTAGVVHRDYIAGVLQVLHVSCGICKHCPLLPKDGHEKQIQFTLERGIGGVISALAINS